VDLIFRLSLTLSLKIALLAITLGSQISTAAPDGLPDNYPESRQRVDSQAFPWRAIGQLNMAGRGSCTATLVGPDIIVTAAHCLWNKETERWFPAEFVHFVAGFSGEAYQAHSKAKQIYINPAYDPVVESNLTNASTDWALIRLQDSVGDSLGYLPVYLPVFQAKNHEHQWLQAGYRLDRSYVLTVHDSCQLQSLSVKQIEGLAGHYCDTTQGDSGGPLLVKLEQGMAVAGVYIGRMQANNLGLVVMAQHWQKRLKRWLQK
jgi:protease YdgD